MSCNELHPYWSDDTDIEENEPERHNCMKNKMGHKYEKLAQAYVNYQTLNKIYMPEVALKKGTAFPELDQPEYCKKTS